MQLATASLAAAERCFRVHLGARRPSGSPLPPTLLLERLKAYKAEIGCAAEGPAKAAGKGFSHTTFAVASTQEAILRDGNTTAVLPAVAAGATQPNVRQMTQVEHPFRPRQRRLYHHRVSRRLSLIVYTWYRGERRAGCC
jgi:hypothetical protein